MPIHLPFTKHWKEQRARDELRQAPPPLIICATGGSGTRVVTRIAQEAGYFMGNNLNHALDSFDTGKWVKKWIPPFLEGTANTDAMMAELDAALLDQRRGIPSPSTPWGFKNPRGIFMLPVYHQRFPEMRFLHVVRDGRDMAFSDNQHQSEVYGEYLINDAIKDAPTAVRSIALWSRLNMQTLHFAHQHLGNRYLLLRFEDLCAKPAEAIAQIAAFLGVKRDLLHAATALVSPPESIGRWRHQDPHLIPQVLEAGQEALREFGYHE
jgi:hypothetical protein